MKTEKSQPQASWRENKKKKIETIQPSFFNKFCYKWNKKGCVPVTEREIWDVTACLYACKYDSEGKKGGIGKDKIHNKITAESLAKFGKCYMLEPQD